jgi:hypothetical protein
MKLSRSKVIRILLHVLLIITISISLTMSCLLRLAFFYEQNNNQRILTSLLITLMFCGLVFIAYNTLILPFLSLYLKWKNVIFIILMIIILISTSSINSLYYWSIPKENNIEICFDAAEGSKNLQIHKLIESHTKRLYSPVSFGVDQYPIIIPSGECVNGKIITMYWKYTLMLFFPSLTAVVQKEPPDGRFYLSINDVPSVVYFDKNAEEPIGNEVNFNEGIEDGETLPFVIHKYLYTAVKAICLIVSSIFLSLFFFGLTEKIMNYSPAKSNQSHGN